MTQCSSCTDCNFSKILLNFDKQTQRPGRFTGYRNYLGERELSPWRDHGHRELQSSVTVRSGSDLRSVPTLCRERTRAERMSSASGSTVTPRWEEIARRQYEQQRTAAGLDPGLSYFRHFVDSDPSLSMRSYRKRCTVEDAGSSVVTFNQLEEDEDPYLRKFRISGDLDERLRLLMMITNSSSMATGCASVNTSNVRLHPSTKSASEQTELRPKTRKLDPRLSSFSAQPPQSSAAPPLHPSKSTISASLPVRTVPAQPDHLLRSSSNLTHNGSGKADVDDCADRMTSFREAVFSYVRDTQRPVLAARSGLGQGPPFDCTRPCMRQHSQAPKSQVGSKPTPPTDPGMPRTTSVISDYRMTLKADPGNVDRKRAGSSRAIMARCVIKSGLMRQTASSFARKRYLRPNYIHRTTGAPFQGGNDNTMFVRLG